MGYHINDNILKRPDLGFTCSIGINQWISGVQLKLIVHIWTFLNLVNYQNKKFLTQHQRTDRVMEISQVLNV